MKTFTVDLTLSIDAMSEESADNKLDAFLSALDLKKNDKIELVNCGDLSEGDSSEEGEAEDDEDWDMDYDDIDWDEDEEDSKKEEPEDEPEEEPEDEPEDEPEEEPEEEPEDSEEDPLASILSDINSDEAPVSDDDDDWDTVEDSSMQLHDLF